MGAVKEAWVPEGYTVIRQDRVTLIFRADEPQLARLACMPRLHGRSSGLAGRAEMLIIEPDMVVRPLVHGGLFRAITGWRFLSPSRSLRELRAGLLLESRGIPTPEILAIRITRRGLFLQIEVVTRLIPDSMDLLAYLEGNPDDTRECLRRAGALIRRMHDIGVYHADLHVKNMLIGADSELYVLDLDRAFRFSRMPGFLRRMNLKRFMRSLEKWRRAGRICLPGGWKLSLRAGYE